MERGPLQLHSLGFNVLPLWFKTKTPALSHWKIRQEQRLSRVELERLFRRPRNLAIILTASAIIGDAVEKAAYLALRRRLDYSSTFSLN